MSLREIFGEDAELYDRMRPGYPRALFDDLAALVPRGRLLEVGPGTGQATRSLIERGYDVTAVEISPTMAERLRTNFSSVSVIVGPFETFATSDTFDVVFSATAFHWVDPAVRLVKAADVLRPGGVLATVRTDHVLGGTEAFFARAQECYEYWDPATPPGLRLEPPDAIGYEPMEAIGADLFEPPIYRRYEWEQTYSTIEYRDLLLTYSGHRALAPDAQQGLLACIQGLIEENGGQIAKRYMNELRILVRR